MTDSKATPNLNISLEQEPNISETNDEHQTPPPKKR